MPTISGSCNRCGQCCGAPGSPNQDSPWPDNWPDAVRTWQISVLSDTFPVFQIVGHPDLGGPVAGVARIGNKNYHFIWIPGHGLCKDEPPYGDAGNFSETCPFLMNQEPDGSYPCGLAGTQYDAQYQQCMAMATEWTQAQVDEWQANHPLCSYTWT